MTSTLTIKTPASTANMGPGFDCLAMSLDIWNTIYVDLEGEGLVVEGEGSGLLPTDKSNLVYKSFIIPFQESGKPIPKVMITCDNRIPIAKGLGSSAAAVVSGLLAGNELCDRPMNSARMLEVASNIEGHSDNVAAAIYGGCQIVIQNDTELITSSVPINQDLRAVVFVPDKFAVSTAEARSVITNTIAREDVVYNIGRAALLILSLAKGDSQYLSMATQDRIHQPARQSSYPAMKNIFRAALNAGALGVFLSGSGSSVLALANGRETTIGYEMAEAASKSGVHGSFIVTQPTTNGAHTLKAS